MLKGESVNAQNCPLCAATTLFIRLSPTGRGYLACSNTNCRIETPICDSIDKCLAIWNKRPNQ